MRYFVEIVERGSFTRAAEALNVAQPALSHHVRKMENALMTPLLIRGHAGVKSTEAGDLLTQRARVVLDQIARTEQEILSLGADPAGTVQLGLPGTITEVISVPRIRAAQERSRTFEFAFLRQ